MHINEELYPLISRFFPSESLYSDYFQELKRLYLVANKSRERVLVELQIHKQSLARHGQKVLGFDDLVQKLNASSDEGVSILCGSNGRYAFELYLNADLTYQYGSVILKCRVKTDEEVLWEKSLGIKHDV